MVSLTTQRLIKAWQHHIAIFLITIAVIATDRMTKFYIEEFLDTGESIKVIGSFFSITRVNNIGAAFGMLRGYSLVFMIAALAVVIMFIYFYSEIIKSNYLIICSSLILGGTIGNLLDRIYFGYVIDYLNIAYWPTFNISDMSLTIGVFLLAIYFWKTNEKPEHKERKLRRY